MLAISEEARLELKKPLGDLMSLESFLTKYKGYKIIAVGDVVVFGLLANGVRPFLSVYDFRTMRKPLGEEIMEKLNSFYPNPLFSENPPGMISEDLERKAELALKSGGALFVKGEEDLATLVFMRLSPDGCVIVYGQPNEGVVAVECNKSSKEKAEYFFSKMEKNS